MNQIFNLRRVLFGLRDAFLILSLASLILIFLDGLLFDKPKDFVVDMGVDWVTMRAWGLIKLKPLVILVLQDSDHLLNYKFRIL